MLDDVWRERNTTAYALWPLSFLYRTAISLRSCAYRAGILSSYGFKVPIVVVGNITVGGSGKTPVVEAVVRHLRRGGWKPGIVSRGYGGRAKDWPRHVTAESPPGEVGDEPVLLARRAGCPIVVDPDRPAAVRVLLRDTDCDVVVADDGLQHLALERTVEIVVVDGERGFGNGFCLPAGPLREPRRRLASVDLVVYNGGGGPEGYTCALVGDTAVNLADEAEQQPLHRFSGDDMHAVAGIGNPGRFFRHLQSFGVHANEHAYGDHHQFTPADLEFGTAGPVLMTEKDAVKCTAFAARNMWYVPVQAELDEKFYNELDAMLERT